MWWILVFGFLAIAQTEEGPIANVHDVAVLNYLESNGYSLADTLGGSGKESNTAKLYKSNALYRDFAETIGRPITHDPADQLPKIISPNMGDIPEMVRTIRNFEDKGKRSHNDKTEGYYIRHLSNNSQYPYAVEYDGDEPRHFDYRWLNSKFGYFKLVALVNRLDKRDVHPEICGEVRFIYRLSYNSPKSSSSLPFFVNVVRTYPKKESCSVFAQKWITTVDQAQSFQKNKIKWAQFLHNGALQGLAFRQLEVNFQSLRFTSGYMHDFGGQAMYMQRIFKNVSGRLEPIGLENTPHVLAIEEKPELLTKFVEYLKKPEVLRKLDEGTLVIDFDPSFLTKLSISWSTLGRVRSADKPYSYLFRNKQDLLKSISLSGMKYIKTHDALVERLNNLTCMGCHQMGGTAGFHVLGLPDPQYSHGFNRQELPLSPHAYAEVFRREVYTKNLAKNRPVDTFRPHSALSPVRELTVGQLCLMNRQHFAGAPGCAKGSECRATVIKDGGVLFGECVNSTPSLAGSACWTGEMTENLNRPHDRGPLQSYNLFSFQDKWAMRGALKVAKGYKCVSPQSGAPLGRSSRPCSLDEENFSKVDLSGGKTPIELCANQGGNGFDICAATGDSGACLESRVVRSMLDTCSPTRLCREDYICQRFPEYQRISVAHYSTKKDGKKVNQSSPEKINGSLIAQLHAKQIGFCVPTYFLFNMRLDGHPSPVTGLPPGTPKIDRTQPLRGYKK